MTKASRTSVITLCAALAACSSDGTTRTATVTAPNAGLASSEAPADFRGAVHADGPFDLDLTPGAAASQRSAASPNAASGSRAAGHVAFTFSPPWLNIASEEYSFVALRTDPLTPYAAKGQYDMTLTTATGVVQEFHGDVICMGAGGDTTRFAGRLTEVVINGVPRAINPNQSHNIWNVIDNGEGQGTTDTATPMIFFNAALAPLHCASDFIPPQFPLQAGNVQVRP